jgi:hypothetical protein
MLIAVFMAMEKRRYTTKWQKAPKPVKSFQNAERAFLYRRTF